MKLLFILFDPWLWSFGQWSTPDQVSGLPTVSKSLQWANAKFYGAVQFEMSLASAVSLTKIEIRATRSNYVSFLSIWCHFCKDFLFLLIKKNFFFFWRLWEEHCENGWTSRLVCEGFIEDATPVSPAFRQTHCAAAGPKLLYSIGLFEMMTCHYCSSRTGIWILPPDQVLQLST